MKEGGAPQRAAGQPPAPARVHHSGRAQLTHSWLPACLLLALLGGLAVADSATSAPAATTTPSDAALLITFKAEISNWDSATAGQKFVGWSGGQASPCGWTGVACDNVSGRVISLGLQGLGLQGTLAPELGQLSTLQTLNLGSNALSGALPASWGSGGGWQKMAQLSLEKNQLNGSLPALWGAAWSFPRLQLLALDSNRLSGALPSAWATAGAFPALSSLSISDNAL